MVDAIQLPLPFSAEELKIPPDAKIIAGEPSELSWQGKSLIAWEYYPGDDALF